MGIALAFRHQPGTDRVNDRKLPHRFTVAIDAKLPIYSQRPAAGGV